MKQFQWPGRSLLAAALGLVCLAADAQYTAPYVTMQGVLSSASGLPAQNATLTFTPSQVMFVAGTTLVVSEAQCSTDTNGYVVGVGNPVSGPRVAAQYVGTLPAGNYYVKFTWYDQFNAQTMPSAEVAQQLSSAGELQILPPVGTGPAGAVGMDVYIGTAPGAETYQGHTTTPTAQFTQAAALTTGANPPISNQTACRVVANDAAWPTGTGYHASLVDASGNTLFSYTELWQFYGPGSTYNLSNGIPYYHGQVTYPVPVLTIPYNHNPQSISGPLSLTSYNLYNVGALGVGTGLPAWGVDVEGSGLDSEINAAGGYLVNGAAGSSGQCLASNGTVFNTPVSCITSLPALYYQTVYSNGTPLTQEPVLNVLPPLTAATVSGQTTLGITTTGSESKVVTAAAAGVSGNCPQWDAAGGLSDTGAPCGNAFTGTSGYQTLPGGLILEWGETTNFDTGPTTVTLPLPFPHACLMPAQLTNNSDISTTTREWESGSCTTTNFVARNDGSGQAHYFVIGW